MSTPDLTIIASSADRRRLIGSISLGALVLIFLALHLYPERTSTIRLVLILDVLTLWHVFLLTIYRSKYWRMVWIWGTTAALLFLLLPGRKGNAMRLRSDYVQALLRYEGTPYYWGGETSRGVDCSGLMRCALVDAYLKEGLFTFNPRLLRAGISLWWHDAGVRGIEQGYQGRTRRLFETDRLNMIEDSRLAPGDMATLGRGSHIIAFLGDHTWIEADPDVKQVIRLHDPSANSWLNQDAVIIRWKSLEEPSL